MKVPERNYGIDVLLLSILEKAPILSRYAKTRGWHYIVCWLQRLTGISLVIALIVHLLTLSVSRTAGLSPAPLDIPGRLLFIGALSLCTAFHALNGGRLILYELFGKRNDAAMIRWTFGLTVAYGLLFGLSPVMGNRGVPASVFWLVFLGAGIATALVVESRIGGSRHSLLWKLQRISGAFLFITTPAYLLFSFLTPDFAGGGPAVHAALESLLVRIVMLTLAATALYHAGYGLFSIAVDYLESRAARAGIAGCIVVILGLLAFRAFWLILSR